MTAETAEIQPLGAGTTGRVANGHWRIAWVLLGMALVALVALNALTLWIEIGGSVDPEAVIASEPTLQTLFRYFGLEFAGDSIGFGALLVVSALALSRDHSNRFAWILGGSVVGWMIATTLSSFLILAVADVVPTGLAPGLAWSGEVAYLAFGTGLTWMVAVFPSGRLPAGRWRSVLLIALSGQLLAGLIRLLAPGPFRTDLNPTPFTFDNPLGLGFLAGWDSGIADVAEVAFPVVAVISLIRTYVKSGPEVRHQVKWIVAVIPIMVATAGLMSFIETPWEGLPVLVSLWLFAAALGMAVLRYRLYEIDLIINRALVYGSLAVFIGVVYVGVVVGVGSLIGSGDEPNAVLSVGATALVAVGFQPVRRRLERVANRLVFGRKATPYEVLSEFSRRVAATSDDLLDEAARSLAEGTRAERVVVSVMVDGEAAEAAAWPREEPAASTEAVSFPILDGDTTLGSLDVFLPAGQQLQDDDRRLAEQLASGMGLALRNQLLTERLEARVEELRESRRRLVAVQDETRRRLERDLHDGAQQQLVALKVKLGLGRAIAEKAGATQTAEVLGRLSGEADQAVDAMREFARGVYPPLLEAEGLASAISAQARRAPIPVSVDADAIGRYPREIESTVYFCVLEALRNTVQHAEATQARVTLTQSNGSLEFQVTDDGAGFETGTGRGVGLTAMADRLDALTGELIVNTEPGNGTTLTGSIPVPAEVTA